jgi:TonB family protein
MKVLVTGPVCILVSILVSALSVVARGRQEPRPQVPAGIVIVRTYDQAGGVLRKGVGFAVSDSGDVMAPGDLIDGASRVEIAATGLAVKDPDGSENPYGAPQSKGPLSIKDIPSISGVVTANAISRAEPIYPEGGKQNHITGSVTVEILIDEAGHVVTARAVGGNFHKPSDVSEEKARKIIPEFQKASVDAARRWKFKPATIHGTPVKIVGTVTFHFAM